MVQFQCKKSMTAKSSRQPLLGDIEDFDAVVESFPPSNAVVDSIPSLQIEFLRLKVGVGKMSLC